MSITSAHKSIMKFLLQIWNVFVFHVIRLRCINLLDLHYFFFSCDFRLRSINLLGAFIVKRAKVVVKCNVILYHVYFERQVCVMYLFKLLFLFAIIFFIIILIFHKFKVISLSFEIPFMHIKHLTCSHQIVLLDLNVLFVYQMCTIHS